MNTYNEQLNSLKANSSIGNLEAQAFKTIYKFFGIKLPPSLYSPIFLNFVTIYSLMFAVSLGVGLCVKLLLFIFAGTFEFDFNASKLIYFFFFLTLMCLAVVEALKIDIDFRRWYCYNKEWIWYQDITYYDDLRDKKLLIFLSIYSILLCVLSFIFLKMAFIRFLSSTIVLLVLYECIKQIFYFNFLKKWIKVKIISSNFKNIEKKVLDNKSLLDRNYISKRNYLDGEITYKYKNSLFKTGQIFSDQESRATLFEVQDSYYIKQWVKENKDIEEIYINPQKPYQAMVEIDVLRRSYVNKYITILGGIILLWIINVYM